jgi:hypothetical protein
MSALPHDLTDLFLAPVALELSQRLADFEEMSEAEVEYTIALRADRQPGSVPAERRLLALRALTRGLDLHGWNLSWSARGLRLQHGRSELVLGVPPSLADYLVRTDAFSTSA